MDLKKFAQMKVAGTMVGESISLARGISKRLGQITHSQRTAQQIPRAVQKFMHQWSPKAGRGIAEKTLKGSLDQYERIAKGKSQKWLKSVAK